MLKIPILKHGTFTDANHQSVTIDQTVTQQVVATYDPSHFRAPLILSHNIPEGEDDRSIENHPELSFGAPDSLEESEGRVWAVFSKLAPKFKEFWKNGQILGFSSSLYPPNYPGNPYGNRWSLRHVAALGSSPPAIKGLGEPIGLSEHGLPENTQPITAIANYDMTIGLSTPEIPYIELAMPIVNMMRRMREKLIEDSTIEKADAVIPLGELEEVEMFMEGQQRSNSRLWDRVYELEFKLESISNAPVLEEPAMPKEPIGNTPVDPTPDPEPTPTPTPPSNPDPVMPDPVITQAQLDAMQAERDKAQLEVIALRESANRQKAESFCTSLNIPYLMNPVALSEAEAKEMTIVDFMTSLTPVQIQFMEGLLKRLPPPVELEDAKVSEVEDTSTKPVSLSEKDDRTIGNELAARTAEIRRKAAAEGRIVSLSEAASQARTEVGLPAVVFPGQ